MIGINYNVNFGNLYSKPNNSCVLIPHQSAGDTVDINPKNRKLPLPEKVRPYSESITDMRNYIEKTTKYVEEARSRAEKRTQDINRIYAALKSGTSYKNVEWKKRTYNHDEYTTIILKDEVGMAERIAHLKNDEIQVIYDVLTSVKPWDCTISDGGRNNTRVNCYYFYNGECVEYISNIRNSAEDYTKDCEDMFDEGQWPCRNIDNAPVERIIGFKHNGGFEYYEDYVLDIPGGYKGHISYQVNPDKSVLINCDKNNGMSYSISKDPARIKPTEHKLSVGSFCPKIFIW